MLLQKLKKNRKGFTLIELIVVVAILAILAAIAVPSFIGLQDRAQQGVDIANASAIAGALNTYNAMQSASDDQITAWADTAQTTLEGAGLWPSFDEARLTNATGRLVPNTTTLGSGATLVVFTVDSDIE